MRGYRIYAHRGYSEKYPENTLLAFKKAYEAGADGVECDLQKSGDGYYVIIHDDALDRVSRNKTGVIREMTLSEIKDCDLGSGQCVPELVELLAIIPCNGLLNLELKEETLTEADGPAICGILLKYLKKEQILISSFAPSLLPYFRKRGFTTGLLIGNRGLFGIITDIVKTRPDYLNLPVRMFDIIGNLVSTLFIRSMMFFGRKIIFYTVNTPGELDRSSIFSNTFITDNVESVMTYLERK